MNMEIRRLRKKAGLTQAKLAKLMGYISPTIVSMWESGDRKPPSDKLPQLARALGCSIDELYFDRRDETMIAYKCTVCGGLQYSAAEQQVDEPCIYCGGAVEQT